MAHEANKPGSCQTWPDAVIWQTLIDSTDQGERADYLARLCYSLLEEIEATNTSRCVEVLEEGLRISFSLTPEYVAAFEHYRAYLSGRLTPELEPIACSLKAVASLRRKRKKRRRGLGRTVRLMRAKKR